MAKLGMGCDTQPMSARCPDCGRRVRRRDIAAGRAACAGCGRVMSSLALSGTSGDAEGRGIPRQPGSTLSPAVAVDPGTPPKGVWFRDDGKTMELGASTRSLAAGIFMTVMGLFWCGITGLFVAFSITAILQGLGLVSAASGRAGSLGAGLFMLLFSTPFVLVGVWMLWSAAMAVGGRVEVTLRGDDLDVFSGIGPVGRRRRVSATGVEGVIEEVRVTRTSRGTTTTRSILLTVPGTKGVRFGAGLRQERRDFVVGMLKRVLGVTSR